MIAGDKFPYYDALDAADAVAKEGTIDVSGMEDLLKAHLAEQMVLALNRAERSISNV